MSTDNLTITPTTLQSRQSLVVKNTNNNNQIDRAAPATDVVEIDRTDSAITTRQDVATQGQNVPVNLPISDSESENQEDQLESAVSDINSYVQSVRRELQFSVSDLLPLGRAIIKVVDSDTDEIIREIPSEDAIRIARKISEQFEDSSYIEGLIFSDQA